ncbi:MAG: prenyltransferase/squalene oxidase repeat-containing protein [Planctomycetota bacterium]
MQVLLSVLLLVAATDAVDQDQGTRGEPEPPRQRAVQSRVPGGAQGLDPKAQDKELLAEAERMARAGVLALVKLQDPRDGSFRLRDAANPAPVAVTALSVLALLSAGEVPGRTAHGLAVERGIRYLIDKQDQSGGPRDGYLFFDQDRYSNMHGHGYAALALSQALGMLSNDPDRALVTRDEVKDALTRAVKLIEHSQEQETGGWSYDPSPTDHEGSMTICMVQALRAAKDAGIEVDAAVIARAVRYVERSQKPDGSFRYKLGSADSSVALTAAAVATLEAAGDWDDPVLTKGKAWLVDHGLDAAGRLRRGPSPRFPWYERLYLAQALFFDRDIGPYRRWFTHLVADLARVRDPATDLWSSEQYSEAYATAMSVLVLSMPLQYLPVHQR